MIPKFRVWSKKDREMYDVFQITRYTNGEYKVGITGTCWELWVSGKHKEGILLQFTGLKDAKGMDIYEGDIVDCNRYKTQEVYRVIINDIKNLPLEMFGSNLNSLEIVGSVFQDRDKVPTEACEYTIKMFEYETIEDA